jgi:phosphatidylserine synthase
MTSFVGTSLRISAGVIVWAVHFTILYGATSLSCARGEPRLAVWIAALATAAAVLLAATIVVREWRQRDAFESWLAAALAALALVAIVWEALPMLIVPACQ